MSLNGIEHISCKNSVELLKRLILNNEDGDYIYRGQLYESTKKKYSLLPSAWRQSNKDKYHKLWDIAMKMYRLDIPSELNKFQCITSNPANTELKTEIVKQSLAEMLLLNIFSHESNSLGLFVTSVEPFNAFSNLNLLERWAQKILDNLGRGFCHGYLASPDNIPDLYDSRNLKFDRDIYLMLSIAQHYGLPTRLLDWSKNPIKACYFALSSSPNVDESSIQIAIFKLNTTEVKKHNVSIIDKVPYHFNKFLNIQEGIFTYAYNSDYSKGKTFISLEERIDEYDGDIKDPVLKVYLLSLKNKNELEKILSELGVTRNSLLPSYEQVANKIVTSL